MTKTVEIIFINYNGKKWLERCLDSALSQDYKDFKVTVIDDVSSDGSVEYVRENYPTVTIIKASKNGGYGSCINLGIQQSTSDIVVLLNTDIWFDNEFISTLVKEKDSRNLDVIAPRECGYDGGNRRPDYVTKIDLLGHPVIKKRKNNSSNFFLTGVALMLDRALFEKVGRFDEDYFMYCEEVDWFWRAKRTGIVFDYSVNVPVFHKGGAATGSQINTKVFEWRNRNTLMMLIKNHDLIVLPFAIIVYVLLNIFESLTFLIIGKGDFAKTYWTGFTYNIKNIQKSWAKRKAAKAGIFSGFGIYGDFYLGIGKLRHLLNYGKEL